MMGPASDVVGPIPCGIVVIKTYLLPGKVDLPWSVVYNSRGKK